MTLEVRNADVVFDGVIQVLRSANLEVRDGQIVALLGSNGAGKTTTLKAISGLLEVEHGRVTSGEILYDGRDITHSPPSDLVAEGIVQVLEGRRVLGHLTVEQNLRIGAHMRADRQAVEDDLERMYGYFPKLRELRSNTAGYLSGGEMQMLMLGRALMARPRYLLLDEPSMGLSPALVQEMFRIIQMINQQEEVSILLVEQNALGALGVCDYGYVMENGRIVLHGSRDKLQRNEDIREFYLGMSVAEERRSFRDVKHYKRRKRWLG